MNNDYQIPNENNPSPEPQPQTQPLPPEGSRTKGFSIASLVLGILSIPLICCSGYNLYTAVPSIVFAVIAKKKNGTMPKMAKAGMILSIVSLAILTVLIGIAIIGLCYYFNQLAKVDWNEVARQFDEQGFRGILEELKEAIRNFTST